MAWPIIVAWIHYVSIMLMIASLLGEHLLLKQELTAAQAGTLQRLDIVYGVSAAIVLITGILRMFLEKGAAYYNHHMAFHILYTIFLVVVSNVANNLFSAKTSLLLSRFISVDLPTFV